MDERILLQPIEEPEIQSFDASTGNEILKEKGNDFQIFLESWEKNGMNPDNFNEEKKQDETLSSTYDKAYLHISKAYWEFNTIQLILDSVLKKDLYDIKYADTPYHEPQNPDILLGSLIVDKQTLLQTQEKFFSQSTNQLREEIKASTKYFRKLEELAHRFNIVFCRNSVSNLARKSLPCIIPKYGDFSSIVLEMKQDGDIKFRLDYPMNFLVNNQKVFFDTHDPIPNLLSRVYSQYFFNFVKHEMIQQCIDYSITEKSKEIEYCVGNFNLNLKVTDENELETTNKKENSQIPIYIPSLISKCVFPKHHPFKTFKEIIDEKVLLDNAVYLVFSRFMKCDFANLKYLQKKRGVVIQIEPYFGGIHPIKFSCRLYNEHDYEKFDLTKVQGQYAEQFDMISSYLVTCNIGHNHFCATDPKSRYSFINIDLRSRGAVNAITKWCELQYFTMFQFTVSAIASRFGFTSKISDHMKVSVKCDNSRKVKFYTAGHGDLTVEVNEGAFKLKTKWDNLPISGSLERIEYLFFFNLT